MLIFVTGANGFIGVHLIEHLLRDGHEVIGLVRTTSDVTALEELAPELRSRLRIVHGDLRLPESLGPELDRVALVYHLGAVLMGTSEYQFREAIVEGTRNLLERLRGNGDLERFLFVSSQAAAGPAPGPEPLDEQRQPAPVSWYGRAKRDAEELVRSYGKEGVPATIVRPTAVYGERERDISGGTFGVVRSGFLPKIGFGSRLAAFVYVGDLVEGMIAAATSPAAVGRTYFLTHEHMLAPRELVRTVADVMGKAVRIPLTIPHSLLFAGAVAGEWLHLFTRARPAITRDKWREVGQRWWVCTPAAAERDFGWRAGHDLRRGMAKAVADWEERRRARIETRDEPCRETALKTYAVALAFGLLVEGVSLVGGFYHFTPWWILLVVIVGVFGGVMGTVAWLTRCAPRTLGFAAGAAIGVSAELLNEYWLHLWEFSSQVLELLPEPLWRALCLGLPAGLMPVLVNAIVRGLYDLRRRLG